MEFEFDSQKSSGNKIKRGISFEEAQAIWLDTGYIEIHGRRDVSEERIGIVGRIANRYWTAFITYHGNKIRMISVRPSRKKEKEAYEKQGPKNN